MPIESKHKGAPERVQIPQESKRIQCPKCPAHMPELSAEEMTMTEKVKLSIDWYAGSGGPTELDLMNAFDQLIRNYKWPLLQSPEFMHEARINEIRRAVNWLHAKVHEAPSNAD